MLHACYTQRLKPLRSSYTMIPGSTPGISSLIYERLILMVCIPDTMTGLMKLYINTTNTIHTRYMIMMLQRLSQSQHDLPSNTNNNSNSSILGNPVNIVYHGQSWQQASLAQPVHQPPMGHIITMTDSHHKPDIHPHHQYYPQAGIQRTTDNPSLSHNTTYIPHSSTHSPIPLALHYSHPMSNSLQPNSSS